MSFPCITNTLRNMRGGPDDPRSEEGDEIDRAQLSIGEAVELANSAADLIGQNGFCEEARKAVYAAIRQLEEAIGERRIGLLDTRVEPVERREHSPFKEEAHPGSEMPLPRRLAPRQLEMAA